MSCLLGSSCSSLIIKHQKQAIMKKFKIFFVNLVIISFAFFSACTTEENHPRDSHGMTLDLWYPAAETQVCFSEEKYFLTGIENKGEIVLHFSKNRNGLVVDWSKDQSTAIFPAQVNLSLKDTVLWVSPGIKIIGSTYDLNRARDILSFSW